MTSACRTAPGRRPPVGKALPPSKEEGRGEGAPAAIVPYPLTPSIPYPTPMPTHTRPVRKMNGGFDFEFFCNRIPCLESALSATDSKIRSIPLPPGPPTASSHPPLKAQSPAPAQRPKLKRLAALFHTPPQRPLFPICDLFRAPPPRPLFPIWAARIQPATGKQVQSWPASPIARRTNESKLRRFRRGSSPVAGPLSSRHGGAGKTRWHESNRLEPPLLARETWLG